MSTLASETFAGMIWLGLLHGAWLGLIAAGVVAIVFQTRWSLTHRSRHAILLTALLVVASGPAIASACQYLAASRRSADGTPANALVAIVARKSATLTKEGSPSQTQSDDVATGSRRLKLASDLIMQGAVLAGTIRVYVLAIWWPVFFAGMVLLSLGMLGMNRLCREAIPAPGELADRARQFGRCLRLRHFPEVRVHPSIDEPCLCGLLRPVILLPQHWLDLAEPETIDAVLAHELAHAKRFDPLVNLSQRMLEIVFFFHPGVHWLSRSLRRHRELCADTLAVRLTGDRLALARALESVARLRVGPRGSRPIVARLGGENVSLFPRIQELLGMMPNRPRFQVWPFAAVPFALILGLMAASVGVAQEKSAPPPAAPPAKTKTPKEDDSKLISLEVRFVTVEPDFWRDGLKGKIEALDGTEPASRWIMDKPALSDFLERAQANTTTILTQAPKVSTWERASIIRGDDEVDIRAFYKPQGIRLWAEVSKRVLDKKNAESRPFSLVSTSKGTCDLPDDSSLVVRAERFERTVDGKKVTQELLVVVTPRKIVPEADEKPVKK